MALLLVCYHLSTARKGSRPYPERELCQTKPSPWTTSERLQPEVPHPTQQATLLTFSGPFPSTRRPTLTRGRLRRGVSRQETTA